MEDRRRLSLGVWFDDDVSCVIQVVESLRHMDSTPVHTNALFHFLKGWSMVRLEWAHMPSKALAKVGQLFGQTCVHPEWYLPHLVYMLNHRHCDLEGVVEAITQVSDRRPDLTQDDAVTHEIVKVAAKYVRYPSKTLVAVQLLWYFGTSEHVPLLGDIVAQSSNTVLRTNALGAIRQIVLRMTRTGGSQMQQVTSN